MQHEQMTRPQTDNPTTQQRKHLPNQVVPAESGSNWQFKLLVAIIGLGVLMLVLKSVGVL
jgi:hypothetical protein